VRTAGLDVDNPPGVSLMWSGGTNRELNCAIGTVCYIIIVSD